MDKCYSSKLPHFAYTPQQLKRYEGQAGEQKGMSLTQLMQAAGEAVATFICDHFSLQKRVLVVTGSGNNAGDGFVVATALLKAGFNVVVTPLLSTENLPTDAALMQQRYLHAGGKIEPDLTLSGVDIIVDGVFGIGFYGALCPELTQKFNQLNHADALRISIDIPSGINALTGEVANGAFAAHHTLTFIALKQGMLTGLAKSHCGTLWFAPLNVAHEFAALTAPSSHYFSHQQQLALRPVRHANSHKNTHGHVLVIAGGQGMAGAARLCAEACLRTGAGLVSVLTHPDNISSVLAGRYELMVNAMNEENLRAQISKASVIVMGCGLGQSPWAENAVQQVLALRGSHTLILDADALNIIAQKKWHVKNAIITPHPKEAARLLNIEVTSVNANRLKIAEQLAEKVAGVSILKGQGTVIADAEQAPVKVNINRSGTAAMASAGMGDVLSGIIAGCAAQGCEPFSATCLAVYIHGLSAEQASKQGEKGLLASDLHIYIQQLMG